MIAASMLVLGAAILKRSDLQKTRPHIVQPRGGFPTDLEKFRETVGRILKEGRIPSLTRLAVLYNVDLYYRRTALSDKWVGGFCLAAASLLSGFPIEQAIERLPYDEEARSAARRLAPHVTHQEIRDLLGGAFTYDNLAGFLGRIGATSLLNLRPAPAPSG